MTPLLFWCPSCGASHQVAHSDIGKWLWCPCGRILQIDGGTFGTVLTPPEGAIIDVSLSLRCFACERFAPAGDNRPGGQAREIVEAEIPGEFWEKGNGKAARVMEVLPVTVNLCLECYRKYREMQASDLGA